jgi:glutamate synthase (ferredoxin)
MPIINREGSDSAILDNVLEFLDHERAAAATRAVTLHAFPSRGTTTTALSERRRAYDSYQSMLMEPWDGPGGDRLHRRRVMGAALDRNGLSARRATTSPATTG